MPTSFTLTVDSRVSGTEADTIELDGEDICLRGGEMFESTGRDILTVTGRDAARQSVVRELPANSGSFPRRRHVRRRGSLVEFYKVIDDVK